jgi:hypothetical protein
MVEIFPNILISNRVFRYGVVSKKRERSFINLKSINSATG